MNHTFTIYYSISEHLELLSIYDKDPVWPIKAITSAWFKLFVQAMGGNVQLINNPIKSALTEVTDNKIIALHEEVEEYAKLYAQLTGRSYELSSSGISTMENTTTDCIFCRRIDINPGNLDIIYNQFSKSPGLFISSSDYELYLQVITKSVFFHQNKSREKNTNVFSYLPETKINKILITPNWFIGGSENTFNEVKKKLESRYDLVHIQAHSDGIDSNLANGVMCGVKEKPFWLSEGPQPVCVANKYCHRFNIALNIALNSKEVLSPLKIKTKVLFFNSCHGVIFDNGRILIKNTLFESFMKNNYICSIITTYGVSKVSFEEDFKLISYMLNGRTLGEAVATLNALYRKNSAFPLIIIGESNINLKDDSFENLEYPPISSVANVQIKAVTLIIKQLTFIKLYLNSQRTLIDFNKIILLKELVIKLNNYENALISTKSVNSSEKYGSIFRDAFARFHLKVGIRIYKGWDLIVRKEKLISEKILCIHCSSPTISKKYKYLGMSDYSRKTINCPSCGIIEDVDLKFNSFSLQIEGNFLKLNGNIKELESLPHTVYIIYFSKNLTFRSLDKYSASKLKNDTNLFSIKLKYVGPIYISVLILIGGTYSIYTKEIMDYNPKILNEYI